MLTTRTRLAVRWTTDPAADDSWHDTPPDYIGTPRTVLAYLADLDRKLGGACRRVSVRRCSDGSPVDLADLRDVLALAEVIAAAELVGRYFAERNVKGWSLGPCSSREAQEALRALLQELVYLDDRGVWRVGLRGDWDVSALVAPALAMGAL